MTMRNIFDVTDFGAIGDGKTDCTGAIQAALDEAGAVRGAVTVPPGNYLCDYLKVPEGIVVDGYPAWSFCNAGGSILTLRDADSPCLLDITGAFGCTIRGLSLRGGQLGEGVHGIMVSHAEYNGGGQEDSPTIEDCRVDSFSGDGVHLRHIWCFSLRHSMLCFCAGSGLFVDGWDGFVLDNWFSGNRGAGFMGGGTVCSVTATGNRVEWNRAGGFVIPGGNTLNITGNYFDRSGGPGLKLTAAEQRQIDTVAVSGNIFNRSGAGTCQELPEDALDCSHMRLERCVNVTITGNSFRVGENDGGGGTKSPYYSVVMRDIADSVITANSMQCGSLKKAIFKLGGCETVILNNNVGKPSENPNNIYPQL